MPGPRLSLSLYPPKDVAANLRWRRAVVDRAADDPDFRIDLWLACRDDSIFFFDGFCWTYDPRKISDPILPFILYPYQERALRQFEEALTSGKNCGVVKSRDLGFTWFGMGFLLHRWNFFLNQSFLCVSRKEVLVDGSNDSLFHHLDFLIEHLPPFLVPPDWKRHRTKLRLHNPLTGSVIEGESSNENIGRAGRRTALWWDEAASFKGGGHDVDAATNDVTNTRYVVSTPCGTDTAYYRILTESGIPVIRAHWSQHPEKARGLYRPRPDGTIERLDPHFDYTGYEFQHAIPRSLEQVRSPWYDAQVRLRAANPQLVAQELDCDHAGAVRTLVDGSWCETYIARHCREAVHTGDVRLGGEGLLDSDEGFTFTPDPRGALRVWCQLNEHHRPPGDRGYVVGVDVSVGSGNSNSVATVVDRLGREKVAELASNSMAVDQFADAVLALCRMFRESGGLWPLLIWEANGPGLVFKQYIVNRNRYPNCYRRRNEKTRTNEVTDTPGFYSQGEEREKLLLEYRDALSAPLPFVNPSRAAIAELGRYRYDGDRLVHPLSRQRDLATGDYGRFHGDRVIADALAVKALGPALPRRSTPEPVRAKPDSYLERLLARRQREEDEE